MLVRPINSTVLAALMGHESSTIIGRRYIHLFDQQRTDTQVRQAMSLLRRWRDGDWTVEPEELLGQ